LIDRISDLENNKQNVDYEEINKLKKSNLFYRTKLEEINIKLKETEKKHHTLLAKHQNFIQKFVVMGRLLHLFKKKKLIKYNSLDRKKLEESSEKLQSSFPDNFFLKLKNQNLKKKLGEIGNITTNFSKDFGKPGDNSKSFHKEVT
jgi:hypothetical protein